MFKNTVGMFTLRNWKIWRKVCVNNYRYHLKVRKCSDCIYSSKRPGHLDKSFQFGAYLFQCLLHGSIQKFMILTNFRLLLNHIELSMLVSWIDVVRLLIILWFIASKYDGWAHIEFSKRPPRTYFEVATCIRMNMVIAINIPFEL